MEVRHWCCVLVLTYNALLVSPDIDEERFAEVGEVVKLRCTTKLNETVDWKFQGFDSEKQFYVYSAGNIVRGYDERFCVEVANKGEYDLIIRYALQADSGVYTCTEDGGFGARLNAVRLNVTERSSCDVTPPACLPSNCSTPRTIVVVLAVVVIFTVALVAILAVLLARGRCHLNQEGRHRPTERASLNGTTVA